MDFTHIHILCDMICMTEMKWQESLTRVWLHGKVPTRMCLMSTELTCHNKNNYVLKKPLKTNIFLNMWCEMCRLILITIYSLVKIDNSEKAMVRFSSSLRKQTKCGSHRFSPHLHICLVNTIKTLQVILNFDLILDFSFLNQTAGIGALHIFFEIFPHLRHV